MEPWSGRSLYVCHSAHEHDRIYAENVAEYLAQTGVACKTLEFYAPGNRPELQQCLDDNPIGILGFNSQLDHCSLALDNFVDAAAKRDVPVIHWILDHPSARMTEFNNPAAPNARFLLVSEYCERYFRRRAPPGARAAATFGVGPNWRSRVRDLSRQSFLQREIGCLIPLNLRRLGGVGEQIEGRIGQLVPALAAAIRRAIERARHDLQGPLEVHFESSLTESRLELPSRTFHACAQMVEDVTQIARRLHVFETAARFPVRIQTDEPPPWLTAGAAATFDNAPGSTNMMATLALMKSCRAVVSTGLTNDMFHDRIANALNAGCVAIIEDNAIHRRLFEHLENALFFRYDDDSLARCLDLVCNHPDQAYEIAQSGFAMRDDPTIRFGNFHHILQLAGR
jgi:hypothetical protein